MEYFHIFLITFFSIIVTTRYLVSKFKLKINPVSFLGEKKDLKTRIKEASPMFLVSALIFYSLYIHIFEGNIIKISLTQPFYYIGYVIGTTSFIFIILGYYQLKDSWRIGIDEKTKSQLVQKGIFRITRNPVYLFFNLFCYSFFLTSGDIIILIISIITSIAMHILILEEEKFLEKKYKNVYIKFRAKVPRYIGIVK